MANTEVKDRVLAFLQAEGLSSAQFAQEIGVQPSSISHIISGRNKPSLDFVTKMLSRYPQLQADWLLFGRGNMQKTLESESLTFQELPFNQVKEDANIHQKDTFPSSAAISEKSTSTPIDSSDAQTPASEKPSAADGSMMHSGGDKPVQLILLYPGGRFKVLDPAED